IHPIEAAWFAIGHNGRADKAGIGGQSGRKKPTRKEELAFWIGRHFLELIGDWILHVEVRAGASAEVREHPPHLSAIETSRPGVAIAWQPVMKHAQQQSHIVPLLRFGEVLPDIRSKQAASIGRVLHTSSAEQLRILPFLHARYHIAVDSGDAISN